MSRALSRRVFGRAGVVLGVLVLANGPALAQVGCGVGAVGCGGNPAEQAQRRMQVQTEIQRQEFTARLRGQEAIDRDRARLDALRQQRGADRHQEQAVQDDIDRRTAAMRGRFTAQPTGPGSWTIRNGQGAPQGVCRQVGSVLVC
jgi:hypothetical protein